MIFIRKDQLKIKNKDSIKNIYNKHRLSFSSKHKTFIEAETEEFIVCNNTVIPNKLYKELGYVYDVTRKYMVFRDLESFKKYLKNRMKSLKLTIN